MAPASLRGQGTAEVFTATAAVKAASGASASAPVTITIDRKMSQSEADKLAAAFKSGGAAALRKALVGVEPTGTVQIGTGKATPTRITIERATGGGRLVTIVTDQPLLFLGAGVPGAKPQAGYDFAVIDITVDAKGNGSWNHRSRRKIKMNQAAFVVEDYGAEAVQLKGVKKTESAPPAIQTGTRRRAHAGAGRGHRRDQREDPRHRTEDPAQVSVGPEADAQKNGRRRESSSPRNGSTTRWRSGIPDASSMAASPPNRTISPGDGCGSISRRAFGCPVQIMNDAAMQALGSYKSGLLLFLGLGTGLGAALVADGVVIPMELAHLPYKNGTWEDYLGVRSLQLRGRKKWQQHVEYCTARMIDALSPDDIVLGGGNAKRLKKLPKGCRLGDNSYAFTGGFRLWENASTYQQGVDDATRNDWSWPDGRQHGAPSSA